MTVDNLSKFSPKQAKCIALLIEGVTQREIGERIGVTKRCVEKWASLPDIKLAVQEGRDRAMRELHEEIFARCREAVDKSLPKSIRRIQEALDDPDARVRLRASEIIGKWSGFYNPNQPLKMPDPILSPEDMLKKYLEVVETSTNGKNH